MYERTKSSFERVEPSETERRVITAYFRLMTTFDAYIQTLDIKSASFDFVGELRVGNVLLVGEGNLSFALSLARMAKGAAANLTATTFETALRLPDGAAANARSLRSFGAKVLHGIDAQILEGLGDDQTYHLIGFQFPNVASRIPVYGRNPNHRLVRNFLRSAKSRLAPRGKIAITVVNSPYYLGAFDLAGAGQAEGYTEPEVFSFYRTAFPGYRHTNTDGASGSALSKYRNCSTWIFHPR